MPIDDTIVIEGAGITTHTTGGNPDITMDTAPIMGIIIPAVTIIAFPADGYSRGDSFPYPSVEIEFAFKAQLIDKLQILDR